MHETVLVNTSRGGVVDEEALCDGLRSGRVAAAGLDIFGNEPPAGSPRLTLPNVVLSPHNASFSDVVLARSAGAAADYVLRQRA